MPRGYSNCKISDDQVEEVYVDLMHGVSYTEIAMEWGVTRQLIYLMDHGRRRKLAGFNYPISECYGEKKRTEGEVAKEGFHWLD